MRQANSKPFWRESKKSYYCWIDGRQRSLGPKKALAWRKYRALLETKERQAQSGAWSVRECLDYYLEHAAGFEPNTLRNRKLTFDAFCAEAKVGRLRHAELSVDHLDSWVKSHAEWSASTRRSHINAIMAAFNHCVRRRKIAQNPIHGVEKPRWERRKEVIDADDERKVYEASRGAFRDFLAVLRRTGARPSELCKARVGDYKAGVITLGEHKADESGEDRTIYLTGEARDVVERLIDGRADGPIFLNSRGEPWTPDTLYCRFKRLRKKLGLGPGVFPYAVRHRFASDAINNGNANPALIAKTLGHADLNMLLKHYLREDPDAVRRALEEVAGP
jgi:integrase/recombinase XerC